VDDRPEIKNLLTKLKEALPELEALLEECNGHWAYEDYVYRFYHQSFKVYLLQQSTLRIVENFEHFPLIENLTNGSSKSFRKGPIRPSRWKTMKIGSALRDRFSKPFFTPVIFWKWL
jgi:hypothetical protein